MRLNVKRAATVAAVLVTTAPALAGCESMGDIATGLAAAADDMNGVYYDNQSFSDNIGGDCPFFVEYGMNNNQTFVRFRNDGGSSQSYTISYNTGATRTAYAEPGQYSDVTWMPGAAQPNHFNSQCTT
ncbi:hypothetical protein [Caulobacter sp. 17J65-9]|uniref:hypothetical protein n=1 Tax=Caulobacter sp. 17J65-9 TaxID=2709382 RepID=UPI0013CDDF17|nr:hypothetical protein [Caulobacter sp. 17J65-9]NEX95372.1 hypothetical protein [Caulobacter sp. 17J65-9]